MSRDLVDEILKKKPALKEAGLRVTLSRTKNRLNLKTIEQAACYYIQKHELNINVSSIIDDRTVAVLQPKQKQPGPSTSGTGNTKHKSPVLPKVKWLTQDYYTLSDRLAYFYGYLYLYENALRLKIASIMEAKYPNWWETKIKIELSDVYKYAADGKVNQAKLPMIGGAKVLEPYEYVTLGHLETIVNKYQSLFIPSVFPTLHFFTGHMVIVKRVRNAMAHMSTDTTLRDIQHAKGEIDILLHHLSTV